MTIAVVARIWKKIVADNHISAKTNGRIITHHDLISVFQGLPLRQSSPPYHDDHHHDSCLLLYYPTGNDGFAIMAEEVKPPIPSSTAPPPPTAVESPLPVTIVRG